MTIDEAVDKIKWFAETDHEIEAILKEFKSSICKQQRENCAEDARLMKNQYGQRVSSDSILNAKEPE